LTAVTDRATQLHAKLQRGTEEFIAAWNAAHPEQMIRRCRGMATGAACARYTTSPLVLCDACRTQGGRT
jgi:hypothetical protein